MAGLTGSAVSPAANHTTPTVWEAQSMPNYSTFDAVVMSRARNGTPRVPPRLDCLGTKPVGIPWS